MTEQRIYSLYKPEKINIIFLYRNDDLNTFDLLAGKHFTQASPLLSLESLAAIPPNTRTLFSEGKEDTFERPEDCLIEVSAAVEKGSV
jgi:hypothetical protein